MAWYSSKIVVIFGSAEEKALDGGLDNVLGLARGAAFNRIADELAASVTQLNDALVFQFALGAGAQSADFQRAAEKQDALYSRGSATVIF